MSLLQWQATVFVLDDWLNIKYPINAPTATASIIQPLYVMNSSLPTINHGPLTKNERCADLHDEERVKDLHRIQHCLDHPLLLLRFPTVSSCRAK